MIRLETIEIINQIILNEYVNSYVADRISFDDLIQGYIRKKKWFCDGK